MKRGIIFSVDAMFALVLVIVASGVVFLHYSEYNDSSLEAQLNDFNAVDSAFVSAYLGGEIGAGGIGDYENASCAVFYTYSIAADSEGPSDSIEEFSKVCSGVLNE